MKARVVFVAALLAIYAGSMRLTGQVGLQGERSEARDWTQDAPMKITEPFTLASVGDVIIIRPASQSTDPGLQSAIKVIKDADVGFGNFESLIRDERTFNGPLAGSMVGTKEVAADLKAMGFKLMNRAGNHLVDAGRGGTVRDRPADGRSGSRVRGRRPKPRRGASAAIRGHAEGTHRPGRDVQRDRRRTVAPRRDLSRRRHRRAARPERA